MVTMFRCNDCGNVVSGTIGAECPYCGGVLEADEVIDD